MSDSASEATPNGTPVRSSSSSESQFLQARVDLTTDETMSEAAASPTSSTSNSDSAEAKKAAAAERRLVLVLLLFTVLLNFDKFTHSQFPHSKITVHA